MKRIDFERIPAQYKLAPFWFWNDLITDEEAARQMELMHETGVDQCIIHARGGLVNEYLSDDWFLRIENCVAQAKRLGMKIWLYDEKDWPSGNCDHTLTQSNDLREKFLQIEKRVLEPGEEIKLDLSSKKYVDVTTYPGQVNLLDTAINGEITLAAHEKTEIYLVNTAVNDYEPYGKYCIDYLNKEAIKKFIESTHEKYAKRLGQHFGDTIIGMFMDETRFFNALPWTDVFAQEFIKRKGYDILPNLHLLEKDDEENTTVRCDYFDVVAQLMKEATFKQLYEWCEAHQLLLIGHFLGEETMASQTRFNGDMMRHYEYFHVPGIDHLGNGIGSLDAKICASAAHNYGKDVVACEAFGACGWEMSYEQMVKISNWLFQQGVNMFIPHAFYYSTRDDRKNDWPPSYFYQWQDWPRYAEYAKMYARTSYLLRDGITEADVLVYYPVETFWSCFKPDFEIQTCYFKDGPVIRDERARKLDQDFQMLSSELLNRNIDFEYLNADAAKIFTVHAGKIKNTLTGAMYSVLVLPWAKVIPDVMLSLIKEFKTQGGKVVSFCDETNMWTNVEEIQTSVQSHYRIVRGTDRLWRTQMHYPGRLHDPYMHGGEQQYGIGVTRYVKENRRIFNITNYNEYDEELIMHVESAGHPEVFNPETGSYLTHKCEKVDNMYEIELRIPVNRTLFVICTI